MAVVYGMYFDENCYIGSSFDFDQRKIEHKSICYNINSRGYKNLKYRKIRESGINWDEINFIIIDEYPELIDSSKGSLDSKKLKKLENRMIKFIKPNLNSYSSFLTEDELKHKIKHDYYYKSKKLYECECGSILQKTEKARHKKTEIHCWYKLFNFLSY